MNHKRRLHDAIVGLVVTVGVALGYYVSVHWLLAPAAIGITLLQSGITGFCPVYFALDRLIPSGGAADASSCSAK
jgi:divalent metal cation (Fe/Co/Zn/Cd) transporter